MTGKSDGLGPRYAMATVMYDAAGTENWVRRFSGPGEGDGRGGRKIALDDSGAVYVTGGTNGIDTGLDLTTIKYSPAPDCNQGEIIKTARCKTGRGEVNKVIVVVQNATPRQQYLAKLDSGQIRSGSAKPHGTVKFKFARDDAPDCGANGVSVCGEHVEIDCGC